MHAYSMYIDHQGCLTKFQQLGSKRFLSIKRKNKIKELTSATGQKALQFTIASLKQQTLGAPNIQPTCIPPPMK